MSNSRAALTVEVKHSPLVCLKSDGKVYCWADVGSFGPLRLTVRQ